ncbi:MAG: hypothetical protein U9R74_00025 [Pseudomonadota bacterium]|nr:hypothetical protein [Pseudomonadota bacterium]
MTNYFLFSVLILALLLFFPVTRLIWVMSVRRLQRRTRRELSDSEIQGQLNRARVVGAVLSLLFSWSFNLFLTSPAVHA